MLTDNCATNIFCISDLTAIRYTRYTYTCPKKQYARHLNLDTGSRRNTASASDYRHQDCTWSSFKDPDPLFTSFVRLLQNGLPAEWRYAPSQWRSRSRSNGSNSNVKSSSLERELWVFWITDPARPHDFQLESLQECDSGIISWETLFASQDTSQHKPQGGLYPGYPRNIAPEYDTVMAAFRNLLDRGMISRGGVRLGDLYVFPQSTHRALDRSMLPRYPRMEPMTILACGLSMYMSSSNLIFQPTFRHLRIRPLAKSDLAPSESFHSPLEVVLSPSGTRALLKPADQTELPLELASQCIEEWSFLFGMSGTAPYPSGQPSGAEALPNTVTVVLKSDGNEIVVHYPTDRVFVPVPLKEAPSDAGGLDGLGSRNLGFIEDLGAKFTTWAWQEKSWNASTLPSVPKLIPPVIDHPPVLAEPRNRLKAGSSAWQQQQHLLHQQQLQQQQQQQKQQQQQSLFLQQQLDAYQEREAGHHSGNIDRPDYWEYTDPQGYLTSLVINSCANMDPKVPDALPTEQESPAAIVPPKPSTHKTAREYRKKEVEADGWIRKPTTNRSFAQPIIHEHPVSATTPGQNGLWRGEATSETAQPSEASSSVTPAAENDAKQPAPQPDTSSTSANMTGSNFALPIDMPSEIPELMDMNPMMRMFGSSNTDDLGDWDTQEITEDDFSFFDEQPRRSRAIPAMDSLSAFDSISGTLSTSVPLTAVSSTTSVPSNTGIGAQDIGSLSTPISTTIPTTSIPATIDSLDSVDSMFMDMEFDMAAFTQPTPPLSAPLSTGPGEKAISVDAAAPGSDQAIRTTPSSDAFMTGMDTQTPGPYNIATPHPLPPLTSTTPLITSVPTESQPTALLASTPVGVVVSSGSYSEPDSTVALVESMSSPLQSHIPHSFSPLRIVSGPSFDDAKYQFGGRFMYRPLFKRRKSYIRDRSKKEPAFFPISLYGPQYHPGMVVEMSQLDARIRRKLSSAGVQRPSILTSKRAAATSQFDHSSALGGSLFSGAVQRALQENTNPQVRGTQAPLAVVKDEAESSSSSDSEDDNGSNPSDDETGDEGSCREPSVGALTFYTHRNGRRRWTARGISSARLAATALSSWIHRELAAKMFGLSISSIPTVMRNERPWRDSEAAPLMKSWESAEVYHHEAEFDTPFLPAIYLGAPPAIVKERTALQEAFAVGYFYDSVRVLCEQAIMGEYPFAESNETTGSSGDISEGQSLHVMLSRRRTIADALFGGIASIPALCDDSFRKTMEVKAMVFEALQLLFHSNQNETSAPLPVPSEAVAQDMGMAAVHHQHAQHNMANATVVTMKGPLSLSQYFSLAEVQPAPTKYGKFQVKKKKPAEPSLFQMTAPDIVVGHNEEWLSASPTILRFWEKLSLEPYSAKKNIVYYVLYPEGADMEGAVAKFWKELSSLFETSLLGQHLPGDVPDGKPGLYPVPLLPTIPGETSEARQVRSLVEGSRKLGTLLGGSSLKGVHTVVYMVNPFSHGAGYFDLARCFSVLKGCFNSSLPLSQQSMIGVEQQREQLVMQMVPIHHVLYPSAFGGFLRFGLRQMAFSVYQRCKVALERSSQTSNVESQAIVYAPAFALAKTAPATIHYSLHLKLNTTPRTPATMHVGYSLSLDERWLICVWTDHRGEMLEHLALDLKGCRHGVSVSVVTTTTSGGRVRRKEQDSRRTAWSLAECLREIWAKTLVYQKRGSFLWKTVITKMGLISHSELAEWNAITKDTHYVSIVAINIDSPMRLYPIGRGGGASESSCMAVTTGMTPAGSGVTTPNPSSMLSSQGIPSISTPNLNTSTTTTPLPNSSAMSSSTPGSTPTPSTPMSAGTLGVNGILGAGLGLGIAGASSISNTGGGIGYSSPVSSSTASGATPGMTGGGGDPLGCEVLENGTSQTYGMVLNHRMPLIIPCHDASVVLFNLPSRSSSTGDASGSKSNSSPASSSSSSSSLSSLDSESPTPHPKQTTIKTEEGEDHPTSEDIKMEEDAPMSLNAPVSKSSSYAHRESTTASTNVEDASQDQEQQQEHGWTTPLGNEIVLPLATGYLIQVPIHSNMVIRERHCLESLGIEVHLVSHVGHHNHASTQQQQQQRLSNNANPSSPGPASASSLYSHQSSPFASSSPSLNSYPGSSLANGSGAGTPNFTGGGGGGVSGIGSGGGPQGSGSLGVALTSSLNVLRDLLKQFHALSHLSLASVPTNCLPLHLALLERLSRVLLLVKD